MYELQSPKSKITVRPGNIVKLNRFDDECWIVNLGWFSYAGNRPINGWYLVSKAYKDKVKPLNLSDLEDIYVIEAGEVKEDYKELDPEIKKLIHDLKVQVEELSREVAQLTVEVEAKDEVIAEKGEEILELQRQIRELESQHRLDAETIATLNSQVTAQAQIIAEKAAEIRELTARVAELAEENELLTQQHQEDTATIAEQQETISTQGEQITELSGEVTDLTTENTRLEALTDTQNDTIQYMIDHPPQPKLYTPPEPIIPESETRVYTPPQNYDGFAGFTVNGVTADIDSNIQPENIRNGVSILGVNGNLNIDLQKFLARDIDFDLEIEANTIGEYLCFKQTGLITCRITGNPTLIGRYAFSECSGLKEIDIPNSVNYIGDYAFYQCGALQNVNIPNSVISIGSTSFARCYSLQSVSIPNGVTTIGSYAFENCFALKNLSIPNSVISIGDRILNNSTNVEFVTIENDFNANNLNLSSSILYSHETILSWFNALADRTGETAYTLTIGSTNIAKMTAEEIAIATNKNWNLN